MAQPGTVPAKPAPPGLRGLAGYCWAEDPKTKLRCCHPVGHEGQGVKDHLHPYITPWVRWK
ncbi:hypothetical protein [Streptomyces scabiei]|uniref:hypothetical protein n=1 Tax=Streptomyces scabiei TaxID=1930 RepID=UPI0029B9DD3E|nr:hypothetical protein [Streptomyces scabiei]MDX3196398.1 hypothetical protein [Streptomyces scabiei]MDX3217773.1 hypothetical protein [Streptomyces scabiei]